MRQVLPSSVARGVIVVVLGSLVASRSTASDEPVTEAAPASPASVASMALPERAPSVLEVGQVLSSAPDLASISSQPPSLDDVRRHLEAGDTRRALKAAEVFVEEHRWGRDRDAAWLAIGLLHREAERHNLASEAFTKVRLGGGPLAPWGAWYEAEQDLARGREWVAIKECERYRESWPDGLHADACLRLMARAHAKLGRAAAARDLAATYDATHKDGPIGEQIDLMLAQWQVDHAPESAVRSLQELAVRHSAPLTGRVAEELLAELRASGLEHAVVPDDARSLMSRATSLRDAKRRDEAWALFETLAKRADDDRTVAAWVEAQAESFGWRTHRWDFLADWYKRRYDDRGRTEDSWNHYRALDRGGRHAEAGAWALEQQKKHGNTREWRRKEEIVARTLMLAGMYEEATAQMDAVVAKGGWTGRRAELYAAFCAFMAGKHEDAATRLTKVIDRSPTFVTEARYWRSRAHDALEQTEEAHADRAWILENDPHSWYAVLARQNEADRQRGKPFARDGSWPGAPTPEAPVLVDARAEVMLTPTPPVATPVTASVRRGAPGFGRLAWPAGGFAANLHVEREPDVTSWHDVLQAPGTYRPSVFFDPGKARAESWRLAEAHKDAWPQLPAIHDLARAGLYDLSGPLMSAVFEDWREAYRNPRHRKHAAARQAWRKGEEWRQLFYFTRDHHHAARFTHGLWDDVTDEALSVEARKLGHPLAHDRYVWTHAREHDIDPYLVMGLMRQESTYNAIAVSHAGARGAMQIMPRTGHLLADLAHDTRFTAGDLEDPVLSVGYGIRYLGLLMKRYDGVYPLAIASYNGGPFNVSNWLGGTGSDMPLDAFVEHIPFRETRDYVKKVTAGYATYLTLYAPESTAIALPPTPRGNHPEIVDF